MDGRRALQRNSIFPRRTCGELLCTTFLGSPYMLSVLSYLNFRSGWTGAAHPSATRCFRAAPAENCCARPPLDLAICCQVSPVLISTRGGRAPRTRAQLIVSAPRSSHRHNRRVKHALLLQFRTPVATVRCQKLHKSRQYNRRENEKKMRLFTRRPYLEPPPQ